MHPSIDVRRLTHLLAEGGSWGQVVHRDEVGSTNAEAQRLDAPWSPVLTEHQTAGRGRLGRDWQEVPGAGLAMSVLVPAVDPPGWLPLAVGLAVREALAAAGVGADLKWPNDVLLPGDAGRKVCGILCQGNPSGGVVIGIGINIHHARHELATATATSLRLVGRDIDRTDLAAAVLTRVRRHHAALTAGADGAKGVRAAYRSACATIGRDIEVHRPDGTREVRRATGIDEHGRLVVSRDGASDTVAAGDVRHIRAIGASPADAQESNR